MVLVRSLSWAYGRAFDHYAPSRPTRVGLPEAVIRRVLNLGLETSVPTLVRDAAMVMFMFVFGCRASTAVRMQDADIV
jgi:integrase